MTHLISEVMLHTTVHHGNLEVTIDGLGTRLIDAKGEPLRVLANQVLGVLTGKVCNSQSPQWHVLDYDAAQGWLVVQQIY